MTQGAQKAPTAEGPSSAAQDAGGRLVYIDNVRGLMIALVVVMHACVTYSGLGSWYYKEPSSPGLASMLVFAFYQSFTQAFFMGLLFLVAGVFVPAAYDRKGFARFLRDRLFRLGVPTLLFMLVLHPLTLVIMALFKGEAITLAAVGAFYRTHILSLGFLSASGPLWFAFALLIFSILYAIIRRAADAVRVPAGDDAAAGRRPARLTHAMVAATIVVMGMGSFLVRTVQPVGTSWLNMQFCYFTQYVVLFVIGLWIGRVNLLRSIPTQFGLAWFRLSLAAGVPAWFLIGGLGGAVTGSLDAFVTASAGGWHWQAAAMAIWESFFCVGFILGLIVLFRERANVRTPVTGFLSANAFGVYVLHTPILVTVSLVLRPLALAPLAKTAVVMVFALAASFLAAALVRAVPGFRRVFS